MSQKIAISFDNEQEFAALMKDYEAKNWINCDDLQPTKVKTDPKHNYVAVRFQNYFTRLTTDQFTGTLIIPFAHYAALNEISLSRTERIQLGDYLAVLNYDKQEITVNDTRIPFSKVTQIHQLITQ